MVKCSTRIDWIDNVKAIACVLVVIGHFIMSMDASNILPYNDVTLWFKQSIYFFHVQLFFICSGFLYSLSILKNEKTNYFSNVLKKLVALGVPYLTFSTVTVLMKMLAGDSVNSEAGGLIQTLFIEPTAPYWYLYVLFFIFIFVPPIKSKKAVSIALVIGLALKIVMISGIASSIALPYFVTGVMNNLIWFAIGMALTSFEYNPNKSTLIIGCTAIAVFTALSIIYYCFSINNKAIAFVLGIIACLGVVLTASSVKSKNNKVTELLTKYNLSIFLMHTIFAAGIRVVLMKLGITSAMIHIPVGITATFIGPIIAQFVMEKIKYLDFFIFPTRYIKISKR